jgi:RloB-like protein
LKNLALKRRILIVGEGRETEYNYFVGFRNAFKHELDAMATSVSVARGKGGNARGIVENAIKEKKKFQPKGKQGDRVFLLLDTEGPGRSPGQGRTPELPAAEKLAAENGIEIVYSCPAIEYWLLCHFEKISRAVFKDCNTVVAELNKEKGSPPEFVGDFAMIRRVRSGLTGLR